MTTASAIDSMTIGISSHDPDFVANRFQQGTDLLNLLRISASWHWLQKHRGDGKLEAIAMRRRPRVHSAPRHTAWQMLKETASAKPYLDELYRSSPEIARLAHLGKEFLRILRNRDLAAWPEWLEAAKHTARRRFVSGIKRDLDAIEAALHLPWSNSPVEGQVHRLKLIKRQMYGRAVFDLLRLRVLQNA